MYLVVIMHVLILSPINNSYFGVINWIEKDDNYYSVLVNVRHKDGYFEAAQNLNNVNITTISRWDEFSIERKVIEINSIMKIDKIYCYSEEDLIVAGRLRDHLGIDGQSFSSAVYFRNKNLMTNLMNENGMLVPEFSTIESYIDIYNFIGINGFPVIIKPVDGAGGINCHILRDANDLERIDIQSKGDYIIQKYIDGIVYHIDALVQNNEIKYIYCSEYINNCLSYKNNKSVISAQLNPDSILSKKLCEYGKNTIKLFPTPSNCLIHLEVIVDNNEKIYFCEIASRLGGGRIRECIINEFNFDPLKIMLDIELEKITFNNKMHWKSAYGFVLVAPNRGIIKELPSKLDFEGCFDYHKFAYPGKEYSEIHTCVENICAFSLCMNDYESLREKLVQFDKEYREMVVWE